MAILKGFPPSNHIHCITWNFPEDMPKEEQEKRRASYWKMKDNEYRLLDQIDEWRKGNGPPELYQALQITEEQYAQWLAIVSKSQTS